MSPRPIFAPLPPGARDLLPEVLRRRRGLQERLLEVFETWGYAPVATPSVEYFEVFGRGLTEGERQRCLRFMAPGSDDVVALRSDVTPQIARLVGQRLSGRLGAGEVVRLAYAADVIRAPASVDESAEEHQVGVELVGDGSAAADAELVMLGDAALRAVGIRGAVIDLAHVGVARSVLDELELDAALRASLVTRLARKDLSGIEELLASAGASVAARSVVRSLACLHGTIAVVERARGLLGAESQRSLDQLAAVIEGIRDVEPRIVESLSIDLGEVRGHDYYSGLRLRVWAPGSPRPLIRGGRYDGLLRRYGADAPATGLVIGLDDVERLIGGSAEGPRRAAAMIVAVAPGSAAPARGWAEREAARARAAGRRAWVEPHLDRQAAEVVAERGGAAELVVISQADPSTSPQPQRWRRSESGWENLVAEEGKSEP